MNGCLSADTQDLDTCNILRGRFISRDPSLAIVIVDILEHQHELSLARLHIPLDYEVTCRSQLA